MVESQVNFLIQGAAALSNIQNNETKQILKCYFLLRCRKLAGKYGLPQKYFSQKTRCLRCLLEWNKDTETRFNTVRLSKRQRQRIKSKRHKNNSINKDYLLHSKEMERICSFCGHVSKTIVEKPSNLSKNGTTDMDVKNCTETPKIYKRQNKKNTTKQSQKEKYEMNVYCKSNMAFSLKEDQNTLSSFIKQPAKIIKNNKKKKDKFAGLCHTAVMAASKLKHANEKNNKLNLFLKPVT